MVSIEFDATTVLVGFVVGGAAFIVFAIITFLVGRKRQPTHEPITPLISERERKKELKHNAKFELKEQKRKYKLQQQELKEKSKRDKLVQVENKVRPVQLVVKYNDKLIKKEDFDKKKFYFEAEPRDYFKRSRFQLRYWLDRRKAKKKPHKIVLVRFELNNGRIREFLIPETTSFLYAGNRYIFDLKTKYQNLDSGIFCYDFHESMVLPIRNNIKFSDEIQKLIDGINASANKELSKSLMKEIDINEIRDSIESANVIETETSLNPTVLQRLIESEIAQGVLRGASIGKVIKILFVLIIIVLIIASIDLLLDAGTSGVLDEINFKSGGGEE